MRHGVSSFEVSTVEGGYLVRVVFVEEEHEFLVPKVYVFEKDSKLKKFIKHLLEEGEFGAE